MYKLETESFKKLRELTSREIDRESPKDSSEVKFEPDCTNLFLKIQESLHNNKKEQ